MKQDRSAEENLALFTHTMNYFLGFLKTVFTEMLPIADGGRGLNPGLASPFQTEIK